jgi:hypothetical protein
LQKVAAFVRSRLRSNDVAKRRIFATFPCVGRAEADRLFGLASEKYAEALKIKPDMHGTLNNWGAALTEQAKTKTGAEADRLFGLASEKYAEALKIKPDATGALRWLIRRKRRPEPKPIACSARRPRSMPRHSRSNPTSTRP